MPERSDRDDDPGGGVVMAIRRVEIAEVRRDVEDLKDDVGRVEERVDENTGKIAELRERQARTEGKLEHLDRAYERAANVAATQTLTEIEVRKAGELEKIKQGGLDRDHRRAVHREFLFKAIAMAMGGVSLLYSLLQSRC